ncbi:hypothetical protein MCAP1_003435 [Malassezia caprae]|uniref:T-cell immunomodulatory protein TIP C2 domain-containing protein n=1 Tax=Malassezia caprae TaxID=1381934 RepID=A0AAF0IWU5_9BASI|nr:hypothetical protein MCAP1_003435 [Malassezia caprae]
MRVAQAVLALAAAGALRVCAWTWLPQRRFKEEGFMHIGSLGLDGVKGHLAAWGYWNDDRFLDAYVVDAARQQVSVHEWMHTSFAFNTTPAALYTVPADLRIVNVVPADFTYNGRTDLLVMAAPTTRGAAPLTLLLWPTDASGTPGEPTTLPASEAPHPLALDATGQQRGDLLGHATAQGGALRVWQNVAPMHFELGELVLRGDVPACRLAEPHSSAHIDLNGDCLADLFLVCEGTQPGHTTYQAWVAVPEAPLTYELAQTGDLPPGTGPLSFADMNRDGTIDVVFAACERAGCTLHIAYNEQKPLCAKERRGMLAWPNTTAPLPGACRDALQLCDADPAFRLHMDVDAPLHAQWPLAESTGDAQLLQRDDIGTRAAPVPIRVGDWNLDGYPDLVVLTVPAHARPGQTRVSLLENVRCPRRGGSASCVRGDARQFVRVNGTVLDTLEYVHSVSFVDLDEDGTLDLVLQSLEPASTHTSDVRSVSFVQNNVFHDSFFLKTLTLNGACGARCEPPDAAPYAPWGGALGGASYKFAVLDMNGVRRAQQVGQQPQTVYEALHPPSAFFGLGRTNNYVESLFVGSTRRETPAHLALEGVIPNSEVVVVPTGPPAQWRRELFLHPADWIPLVTLTLSALLALLGAVVFMLDLNEKREDERERQRAVHAINFDAL